MTWPGWEDAWYGPTGTDLPLETYLLSGGNAVPISFNVRKSGTWVPMSLFRLPADLTEPPPPPPPDTTVINITDLLLPSENLSGLNNTATLQNALSRLIRRSATGTVGALIDSITTDHVTLDWEDTLWLSEDTLVCPTNADVNNLGILHICQNWPKGMTWQNGGIQQNTDDGYLNGLPSPNPNRNRAGIILQQHINRPEASNFNQWLLLDAWRFKGAHTYAKADYSLAREGQEGIWLQGQQWLHMRDCEIEQTWGDCINFQRVTNEAVAGRDNDVYPGMINIEGGRFQRPGIMHITLNQCCAPDAVKVSGFWKNDPQHLDWVEAENIMPSASGAQYGLWWHGNATHPFVAIDGKRSQVDIEPQASYDPIQDITIGADDGDRENFRITHPQLTGGNFIQSGPGWMQLRRFKIQHVKREGGGCGIFFRGSPDQVVSDTTGATTTVAAGSNGVALPTATIVTASTVPQGSGNWTKPGQIALRMPGNGWTCVQYTSFTGANLTGCSTGVGTMTTGMQIRTINGYKDAANTAGLPGGGVTLGAVGSLFNATGILPFDFFWGNPRPQYIRVWTESGLAILTTADWTGNNGPFTGVRVQTGTGWVVKNGMAITAAFKTPERSKYTVGDIEIDDYWWDNANVPARMFTIQRANGAKITNCRGPYTTDLPFGDIVDVPNFNKGGSSQYGSNTFWKQ